MQAQATEMGIFDEILIFDETHLDVNFVRDFADHLTPEERGFGYWCWKPQILLQALSRLDFGDVIQYSDIGSHLNPQGVKRLGDYFEITSQSLTGVLAFSAGRSLKSFSYDDRFIPDWPDSEWTKGDLLDFFGVREMPNILESSTIQSGAFFIKKTPSTIEFLHEWLNVFYTDFALVDDSPSKSPNFPGFKEHRHDQAIFSILCKLRGVFTLSASEFWYPVKTGSPKGDWNALRDFPIHAKRDLDFGIIRNVTRRIAAEKSLMKKRVKFLSSIWASRTSL